MLDAELECWRSSMTVIDWLEKERMGQKEIKYS